MKIVISKMPNLYIQVLHLKLQEYYNNKYRDLNRTDYTDFCSDLILLENIYLLVNLTNKILLKEPKKAGLKLTITQAVVLQSACNYQCFSDGIDEKAIYKLISDQVHQQIKSIIL